MKVLLCLGGTLSIGVYFCYCLLSYQNCKFCMNLYSFLHVILRIHCQVDIFHKLLFFRPLAVALNQAYILVLLCLGTVGTWGYRSEYLRHYHQTTLFSRGYLYLEEKHLLCHPDVHTHQKILLPDFLYIHAHSMSLLSSRC